jgi:hypothetical protein
MDEMGDARKIDQSSVWKLISAVEVAMDLTAREDIEETAGAQECALVTVALLLSKLPTLDDAEDIFRRLDVSLCGTAEHRDYLDSEAVTTV